MDEWNWDRDGYGELEFQRYQHDLLQELDADLPLEDAEADCPFVFIDEYDLPF